jgi:VWFA-related protein
METLPLNLIYLVDAGSHSSGGGRLAYLVQAAGAALDGLQPRDRVALLSFSNRVRILSPLTADHTSIQCALDALVVEGTRSALRDAVFTALALRSADPGRTVLLLFSKGWDQLSWLREGALLDAAKGTDIVVYALAVRDRGTAPMDYGKPLDDLADATGGRVVIADDGRDLRGLFLNILAECRGRYVLTYAPTGVAATGWHRLDVRLKGKPGTITARRGYYAD